MMEIRSKFLLLGLYDFFRFQQNLIDVPHGMSDKFCRIRFRCRHASSHTMFVPLDANGPLLVYFIKISRPVWLADKTIF